MTAPLVRIDLADNLLQLAKGAVLQNALTDRLAFHRAVYAVCRTLDPRPAWQVEWVDQVDALFASLIQCVADRAAIDDDADSHLNSIGLPQLAECVADTRSSLDRDITTYTRLITEMAA